MRIIIFSLFLAFSFSGCTSDDGRIGKASAVQRNARFKHVTILGTNDIHGGVEATKDKTGRPLGGMSALGGVVNAIRRGISKKFPGNGGVLLVDSGDQFQGTFLSNRDEGQLIFSTMNAVGYDAVIPGNHDYDFGPIGWEVDQSKDPSKKREALERLIKMAKFPLVSANTFYSSSFVDKSGNKLEVESEGCLPKDRSKEIDWERAVRPGFLIPYVIKEVAGVRVALIGLDNPKTPSTTTAANVSDLCFADEYDHYLKVRNSLEGKADIFVLMIHDGNSDNEDGVSILAKKLSNPQRKIDVIMSGHTHFTYRQVINDVPILQSGSGGLAFGRVDLTWDSIENRLVLEDTKSYAGLKLYHSDCDLNAKDFCVYDKSKKSLTYDGEWVTLDSTVAGLVAEARKVIAPEAGEKLARTNKPIKRDRISESELANLMTDLFRELAGTDVATLNTGGIRNDIEAGTLTYEDLFRIFPFGNHGLVVGPVTLEKLVSTIKVSIQTCGKFGALMQSGLKVIYTRDCRDATAKGGIDRNAKLVKLETLDGKILFEDEKYAVSKDKTYLMATLDFLQAGGDGFKDLKGLPIIKDLDIMRNALRDHFRKYSNEHSASLMTLSPKIDDRWKNTFIP